MESNHILISVIIPVYNSEKYLERCLQSILQQTHTNLEIILVDDGSFDKSGQICDRFGQKDSRIKVIHKKNGGQAQARNRGLDIAQGEYIGFMDNDDVIEPEMFETLLENALRQDAQISGCSTMQVYSNGNQLNKFIQMESGLKQGKELILNILYQNQFSWGTVWNKIFHKDLKADLYFQEGKELEDYGVMLRLFNKVDRIYFEQIPMYHWYQYSSSQSKRGFHKNSLTCLETIDSLREYFIKETSQDTEISNALDYFEFITRYGIINGMCKSDSTEVHKMIKGQLRNIKGFIPGIIKNRNFNITNCKRIIKIYMILLITTVRSKKYS